MIFPSELQVKDIPNKHFVVFKLFDVDILLDVIIKPLTIYGVYIYLMENYTAYKIGCIRHLIKHSGITHWSHYSNGVLLPIEECPYLKDSYVL